MDFLERKKLEKELTNVYSSRLLLSITDKIFSLFSSLFFGLVFMFAYNYFVPRLLPGLVFSGSISGSINYLESYLICLATRFLKK